MSKLLAEKLNAKIGTSYENVDYDTLIEQVCKIHGSYFKSTSAILYKNPNCPECTKLAKNKKLSEIGKTKIGELNSFYGHTHSEETLQKLRKPCPEERKKKISNTIKSEKCQAQTKQTNLDKYGVSNPNKCKLVRDKIKKTCNERYGGQGSQSILIKQRMQKTNIVKYGTISPWGNKDVQNKCKQTMLEKYGYENPYQFPENQEKARKAYTGHINKYEEKLYEVSKQSYSGKIKQNCRTVVPHFELDLYFEDLKLAVEFNGNYWHSYPRKSKDYHLQKALACRNLGIRLISIYEFEDFNAQLLLLKNYLQGNDNYPKNDFNKNNLISTIPKLFSYETNKGIVYTVGKIKEENKL